MKKKIVNLLTLLSFVLFNILTQTITSYATVTNAFGEVVDENGYPVIGQDEDVYSNTGNHKSNNLVTMFKDFTISTETREQWEDTKSNPVIAQGMKKTGVGSFVDAIFDILDYLENAVDDGKTAIESIQEYAIKQVESLNPLNTVRNKVIDIGTKLTRNGQEVSLQTTELISKASQSQAEADEYFVKYPEKRTELQQGVPLLYSALLMFENETTQNNNDAVNSNSKSKNKNSASPKGNDKNEDVNISVEGNGGSVDHSDGISEDELIQELMYLDSLGLSDDEYNRQLEEWAAQHGAY